MAEYEKYLGKYTRTSAENYEEFLKELEVNWGLRKAATYSTPVLEVILFLLFLKHPKKIFYNIYVFNPKSNI